MRRLILWPLSWCCTRPAFGWCFLCEFAWWPCSFVVALHDMHDCMIYYHLHASDDFFFKKAFHMSHQQKFNQKQVLQKKQPKNHPPWHVLSVSFLQTCCHVFSKSSQHKWVGFYPPKKYPKPQRKPGPLQQVIPLFINVLLAWLNSVVEHMPFAGILGFTFAAGMVGALGWMEDGNSGLLVGEIRATGTVGFEKNSAKLQRGF